MEKYMITFRSVTYAQRGEAVLRSAGFRCALGRTPRWMEEQGCGYALRLTCPEIAPVQQLLRREKLSWRRIYEQKEDGTMEVLEL